MEKEEEKELDEEEEDIETTTKAPATTARKKSKKSKKKKKKKSKKTRKKKKKPKKKAKKYKSESEEESKEEDEEAEAAEDYEEEYGDPIDQINVGDVGFFWWELTLFNGFLVSDSAGILAKLPAALPFLPVLLVVRKCTFFCVLDTIKKNPFPRKLLFAEAVKQYFFSPAQRDAAATTQQLISAFFASDGSLFNGRSLPQKKTEKKTN